jgi:hypothetical protein
MTKRDDKIEITRRLPTLRPISGMERKGVCGFPGGWRVS